jgi:hypothetical protein
MSQVTGPGLQTNSEKVLQTIIFNAFVFCQVHYYCFITPHIFFPISENYLWFCRKLGFQMHIYIYDIDPYIYIYIWSIYYIINIINPCYNFFLNCDTIFLVYVWWEQVFNEINARKPDKINVLTGLFSNHLFLYVISFTSIAQVKKVKDPRPPPHRLLCENCSTMASSTLIKVICKVTLAFSPYPLSFHPFIPSFNGIRKVRKFLFKSEYEMLKLSI